MNFTNATLLYVEKCMLLVLVILFCHSVVQTTTATTTTQATSTDAVEKPISTSKLYLLIVKINEKCLIQFNMAYYYWSTFILVKQYNIGLLWDKIVMLTQNSNKMIIVWLVWLCLYQIMLQSPWIIFIYASFQKSSKRQLYINSIQ